MGQKHCSCICNKEPEEIFNFYPDILTKDDEYKEINPSKAKGSLMNAFKQNQVYLAEKNEFYKDKEKEKEKEKYNTNTNYTSNNKDDNERTQRQSTGKLEKNYPTDKVIIVQSFLRKFLGQCRYKKLKEEKIKIDKDNESLISSFIKKSPTLFEQHDIPKFNPSFNPESFYEKINENLVGFCREIVDKQNTNTHLLGETKPTATIASSDRSSVYKGEVNSNNEKDGYGVLYLRSKEKYEGNWIKNEFTGWGRYTDRSGSIYEGKLNIIIRFI